jgi:protein-L-isoaspartate(D-aspartate) O-methyltransferase
VSVVVPSPPSVCRHVLTAPRSMFIPVADGPGTPNQHVWIVAKDAAGRVSKEKLFSVMYVPLTDAPPHAENDDAA